MPSEDCTWKFTPRAADQFDGLDPHVQDRIVTKLDEVIDSEWRSPDEFLDVLIEASHCQGSIRKVRQSTVSLRPKTVSDSTIDVR